MEERDRTPDTQPFGALEPPRRRPPTAVGLLTLPPQEEPEEEAVWYPMANRMRSVAQAILGTLFVAVGPAIADLADSLATTLSGVSVVIVGGSLWWRVAAARREERRHQEDRALDPPARRQRAA